MLKLPLFHSVFVAPVASVSVAVAGAVPVVRSAVAIPAPMASVDVALAVLALVASLPAAFAAAVLALVTVAVSWQVAFVRLPPPMLQNICFHLLFEIEFLKSHPTVLRKIGLQSYPSVYPLS